MPDIIRTLIIDDSAFARKVVREVLSTSPFIDVVATARDGEEGLELTARLNPDVVICDLQMPNLNGVEYVRRQMRIKPLPILILSAAASDAEEVLEALAAGAADLVQKPSALATDNLRNVQDELVQKLRAAAGMRVLLRPRDPEQASPIPTQVKANKVDIVAIGISTGGPQALRRMMPMFPANFPVPIAVVLHMPVGYTALFAEKLNEICPLTVKEATEGEPILPGHVYVAQAGRHLCFRKNRMGAVVAHLTLQPLDKVHRPAVDVLFRSACEAYKQRVLAVVMTGMGNDGEEGSAWVKAQGGSVITESEKSCVIYGMPRSVIEAGLSDASVSLDDMASAIAARL